MQFSCKRRNARCEETYVVSIEKMWQEGEDPEKEANLYADALPMVLSGTYRSNKST